MQNVENVYATSPMQQEIVLRILRVGHDEYMQQICWTLEGDFDVDAFASAWRQTIRRHPILRTGFFWEGLEKPLQVVRPSAEMELAEHDWRGLPGAERGEALRRLEEEERTRAYDYAAAPLMRLARVRTGERTHCFAWSFHHLILDGWSAGLCLREVLTTYGALCGGAKPEHGPVSPYAAYLEWLARQDPAAVEAHWRGIVGDFDAPTPLPGERAAGVVGGEERYGLALQTIPGALTDRLRAFSRRQRVTPNTLFQAAWGLLLSRYSGDREVVFGSVMAGRPEDLPGADAMLGVFISTIATRVRVEPGMGMAAWLRTLQAEQTESRRWGHVPLGRVHEWSGIPHGERLFHSLLVFQNLPEAQFAGATVAGQELRDLRGTSTEDGLGYALLVEVRPGREMQVLVRYDESRLDAATARRLAAQMETVLDAFTCGSVDTVGRVALVGEAEREMVLRDWNDTGADCPRDVLVHQLIAERAAERPDAPAVVCGRRTLSYAELSAAAGRLAARLRARGVGPEVRVALVLDRSAELAVAVLAVLRAGGAFVPLDPDYPRERLAFVLADSGARLVLTRAGLRSALPATEAEVLCLDAGDSASGADEWLEDVAGAEKLAYAIYTSGSTGRPKAAMVSHRSLAVYAQALRGGLGLLAQDRILQFASPGFDVMIEELFPAWTAGAAVVFPERELLGSPAELLQMVEEQGVTGFEVPTAYWHELVRQLAEEGWRLPPCVRFVIIGGERVLPDRLRAWVGLGVPLVHVYGLTETTVTTTTLRLEVGEDGARWANLPIGRPVENARVYVLDREGEPVPAGVTGELYVGGPAVGRGYLGRPGLTAERYLPDPFSAESGARLYRTGDRARWLLDGSLEFLGRFDHQVKIRGFRIEPAEVEAALATHPAVRQAAVVVREAGDRRLAAYVVPVGGRSGDPLLIAELRAYLGERLPAYMVPTVWVALEALPLTRHGKVDLRALPAAEGDPAGTAASPAPRDATERTLAEVWVGVLRCGRVGVHDNFFGLGGDSILALQVVARARREGVELTPRQLFENPTIAALARVARATVAPAGRRDGEPAASGVVPLAPVQRWFFAQEMPERHHWNMPVLLEARGRVDAELLERALAAVVERHDALRARFREDGGAWVQEIAAAGDAVVPAVVDLSHLRPGEEDAALERAGARVQSALDLTAGPLMRAVIFRLGAPRADRLLLAVHHLSVDGVSWRVLMEDLGAAYSGAEAALPPESTPFRAWVLRLDAHARSGGFDAELPYWTDGARHAAVSLPLDYADGRAANTAGTTRTLTVALSPMESAALLRDVPPVYRTQVNDALLTALARAMSGWTGGPVLVELEGHGREDLFEAVDLSRTVGWFTTLFPVLLDPGNAPSPGAALRTVKEQLRAVPGRGIGYGALRWLGSAPAREALAALPEPEVTFNYLGQVEAEGGADAPFALTLDTAGPAISPAAWRPRLLEVDAMVEGGSLRFVWRYSRMAHREETVRRLAERVLAELRSLIVHCASGDAGGCTPSDFPLAGLDQSTLDRVVEDGRGVEDVYPLTPMQEGMLFHSVYAPDGGAYVAQYGFALEGELDADAFERAWSRVVERHPALRSTYVWEGVTRPLQVVRSRVALPFERLDWRALPEEERAERLNSLLAEDRARGFDLARPPQMRLTLIRTGEAAHSLLWSFHQMSFDGWSLPLVLRDVVAQYGAGSLGEAATLPEPRPFRDYVALLARRDDSGAEGFWREALAGFAAPTPLGIDHAPGSAPADGPGYGRHELLLDPARTTSLEEFARAHHVTLNTLVQGAWALLLARYSGDDDVLFGATVSGRPVELNGVEEMVGLFINTLPVRVRVAAEACVLPWLRGVQERQAQLREWEHTPLARVLRWSEIGAGEQLFETLLVFENYPVDGTLVGAAGGLGLRVEKLQALEQGNYPVALAVIPGDRLAFRLTYDRRRVGDAAAARVLEHLGEILAEIAAGEDRRLGELAPLSTVEQAAILNHGSGDDAAPPLGLTAVALFADQATRAPDAVAVLCGEHRLTYAELDRRSGRLAAGLRVLGVHPGTPVGVCLERGITSVVALLAVWRAGGVYVPLDPSYPSERLRYLVEDSRLAVVLTERALVATLPEHAARVVCLDAALPASTTADGGLAPAVVDPRSLSYIIYTSGSTGRPKGVRVEHGSLANLLVAARAELGVGAGDTVAALASFSFDISLLELLASLVAGGTTRVVPADRVVDVDSLVRELEGVTVLHAVPALMRRVVDVCRRRGGLAALRRVLVGGDQVPPDLLTGMREAFPSAAVHVLYGPTEGTVLATSHLVPAEGHVEGYPIGLPLGGVRVYVCGWNGELVPAGIPGELLIGGTGVARDYLGRPELTAEKFVPDPFSGRPGARLYRTGDRVRRSDRGTLEFVGRVDQQVKIRGFRIEPGEVEFALLRHPAVREAVVAVREDVPGERRLVAYVVGDEEGAPTAAVLRSHLGDRLPDYMVPTAFVALDALPVTAHGKVDRRSLPAPVPPSAAGTHVAPRGPAEEMIAEIWADVLGVDRVGAHDDFFELGGHSLLATRAVSQVREAFGVELPLRALFEAPTVAAATERVEALLRDGAAVCAPPPTRLPRTGPLPLSFAQQRLWVIHQIDPDDSAYHVPAALSLRGALDTRALRRSLTELVRRHETLRTVFAETAGEPVQVVLPPEEASLPLVDLAGLREEERGATAARLAAEESLRRFDLSRGPLFRNLLLRLAEAEHVLLCTLHHVVSDAWSMGVLVRDVSGLYDAFSRGEPSPLPPLPVQYADYAAWQRAWLAGEVLERQLGWWRETLAGAPPVLELPIDRPRLAAPTFRGASHRFTVPASRIEALQALSRREGATLFMTLLAAWQVLLARYSGQEDFLVGTPIAGRTRNETEGLIGFFVNTLVLRGDLSGDPSFPALLARVREAALGAYAHQDLPFERLVEELAPERNTGRHPLVQVLFALQNAPAHDLRLPGLTLEARDTHSGAIPFDLTLAASETADALKVELEYSTELFDPATARRLAEHFAVLLEGITIHPERRACDLPLLTETERARLLTEWNATDREYPRGRSLHALFAEQAARTRDAAAVIWNGGAMSYAELDTRADRLARQLLARGVRPEARVGICVRRGPSMPVAILATLKAGAAYLPLDPEYPPERLGYLLADSGAWLVLTEEAVAARLPATAPGVVCLDTEWERLDAAPEAPEPAVFPESLAYVIYTSGSTGQPKGVAVPHHCVVNFATDMARRLGLGPSDRFLQFASPGFDVVVEELFPAWLSGAAVVLASGNLLTPRELLRVVEAEGVTGFELPTAYWHEWVQELTRGGMKLPASLRFVIVGGERVLPERLAEWSALGVPLVHVFGLTETACTSTTLRLEAGDDGARWSNLPVGTPHGNVRLYVLDPALHPTPLGVPGELFIGGEGVARGYHGQPALTAKRFVPDPFGGVPGARLYRTGDRVRWLADGNLEFQGRIDQQVKIRGFRVEPAEVEAALSAHASIREAAVVAWDRAGDRLLAAYLAPAEGYAAGPEGLRRTGSARAELWPSHGEYPVYDDLLYHAMARDDRRNQGYREALAEVVRGRVAVDVGTGGECVLARLCVEAGARKVYAVEVMEESFRKAQETIRDLGLEDRIELIHGDATAVELPEPVDVCVSKLIGCIGSSAGAVAILNHARRWLKPGGAMIPRRCATRIAAVALPEELHAQPAFEELGAQYAERIFRAIGHRDDVRLCVKGFPKDHLLSDAALFEDLDFTRRSDPVLRSELELRIGKAGRLDGFLLWIQLYPGERMAVDALEDECAWLPMFFPAFYPGVEVGVGDVLRVECSGVPGETGTYPDYHLRGVLVRSDGSNETFAYDSWHLRRPAQPNALHRRIVAPGGVRVRPDADERVTADDLRERLAREIPSYMVPSAFVFLPELPLTAHGKLDRRALPEPGAPAPGRGYVAPRTPTEEMLAGIMAEVLGLARVGARDDFFALGGHSLLATRIVSRVRQAFGTELPLRSLFAAPTVVGLARRVEGLLGEGAGTHAPPIVPAPRDRPLPLSYAQQRLWFLHQMDPESSAYHVPFVLRVRGALDAGGLQRALEEVVRRHEALRTVISSDGGDAAQVVLEAVPPILRTADLRALPEDEREAELRRIAEDEATRPFDLRHGPLLRALAARSGVDAWVLFFTMHHIVSDGWSMGVLVRETSALYEAFTRGAPSPLPELPVQYADFAVWQRGWLTGDVLERQLAWWRASLAGAPPVLELPADRPRPAVPSSRGARHLFALGTETSGALRALSRREGTTLFMTLLAAFQTLLAKYSGQDDLVVGTPIANRVALETEGLIGFFVNTLALRGDLSGDPTFRELLGRVREATLGAYAHQDLPFERLVEEIQPERSLGRTPLFQVTFTFEEGDPEEGVRLGGVRMEPLEWVEDQAKWDLSLTVGEERDGLGAAFTYAVDLFDATTVERMAGHLGSVLRGALADPGCRLSELEMLGAGEREQVLRGWNPDGGDVAVDRPVHELIAEQAARTPEATAVIAPDATLTYAELDARADGLARVLRRMGVGPEKRVGLCVERSADMIVGVLGILRAGGGYVPVDPAYPPERIAYILADSEVPVLVSQAALAGVLPEHGAQVALLDAGPSGYTGAAAPVAVCPDSLAYVIYTSGSTGRPKGVRIEHRSLANTLLAARAAFGFGQGDRIVSLASFAFDIWAFECLLPLLCGASVQVVPRERVVDLEALVEDLEGATLLHAVPSLMRQLVQTARARRGTLPRLRCVFVGGDAVPPDLLGEMREVFPRADTHVLYGPTEATIICAAHLATGEEGGGRHLLGRPLGNAPLYVLDGSMTPMPVGVPGELCIGGASVGRDYLGRPELTAERFIPDPFSALAGARMYRTGDRARWNAEGTLEFLGRVDEQVKIRGYRIEPGEVETTLKSHASVREAVVLAREDASGERRLVGYVVPASGGISLVELGGWLRERLPEYMVPSALVGVQALPLTANGKLDRSALPAPDAGPSVDAYVAPRNPTEEVLAEIWAEVLGARRIGVHDDFFALGGHSLLATHVVSRVRGALGVDVPLRAMFEAPTVAEFAQVVPLGGTATTPDIGPRQRAGEILSKMDELSEADLDRLLGDLAAEEELEW
ncbi:MAG TPA: non-ribosomal peptide synthase/polyketide synthase [Longimicrobiaceae bacterium]|nr:non-ribosomal peptide synthase/polyketide synthase [Longimicrobiaceae bacterium]